MKLEGVKFNGGFLLPPRPERALPRGMLGLYERRGWWAQYKKNGTCSVITVVRKGKQTTCSALTRHGTEHKLWSFTRSSRAIFSRLPEGTHVIIAELMHSKVKGGTRDTHYIHDILVYSGKHLVGTTYARRHRLLREIFLTGEEDKVRSHYILDDHAWLARNIKTDLRGVFDAIEDHEDEGLVLKNPDGVLGFGRHGTWSAKCRYPHKNFGF